MSNRRVVVTGIGLVTPIGSDLKTFWENVVRGKSGVRRITQFDSSIFPCNIAGEYRILCPQPISRIRRTSVAVRIDSPSSH